MRTICDLDDDVWLVVERLAQEQQVPIGTILSDLARQALGVTGDQNVRNGVPLFPIQPGAGVVTLEVVNQLRNDAL